MARGKIQIPPDLVVKSQPIEIAKVILSTIKRSKVVQTLCRNRKARFELLSASLSTSEAYWCRLRKRDYSRSLASEPDVK